MSLSTASWEALAGWKVKLRTLQFRFAGITKGPGLWLLWAAFKLANAFWEKILSQHCFNLVNLYARRGG